MNRTFAVKASPPIVGVIASCLLCIVSACGADARQAEALAGPSALPPSVPRPPAPEWEGRQISVGERVTDTLTVHGSQATYLLKAPSDGTLILRLSWDSHQGLIELRVDDKQFMAAPPDWSPPIVAVVSVAAGQTYRVTVMDGAPWDYDNLNLPYVLATSAE